MPPKKPDTSAMQYQIGDIVFFATSSTAGEYTVIGHPKGKPHVLVFEGGADVDVELCQPTDPVYRDGFRREAVESGTRVGFGVEPSLRVHLAGRNFGGPHWHGRCPELPLR